MRKTVIALAMSGVLLTAACGQDEGEGALEQATVAAEGGAAAARQSTQDEGTGSTSTTTAAAEPADDEDEGGDDGDTVVVDGSEVHESSVGDGSTGGGGSAQAPCEVPVPALRQRSADAPPVADDPDCGPTPEPVLGTGDVQVTLRWESNADVDLHVYEPDGTEIYFGERGPTSTGGQLDVDSNVGCAQEASVENAYWPTGGAPNGDYRIEVVGYQVDGCGSGAYTVTATVRGEVILEETGEVGEDEVDGYDFSA